MGPNGLNINKYNYSNSVTFFYSLEIYIMSQETRTWIWVSDKKTGKSLVHKFNDDNQVRNYVTFIFQSKFRNVTELSYSAESRVLLLSVQKILKSAFKIMLFK